MRESCIPTCARWTLPAAMKFWSRNRRRAPSGLRSGTGLLALARSEQSGLGGFGAACRPILAGKQPGEVLKRYQVGVDASHDALADQGLVLRSVQELEFPFLDAVHAAEIHGFAFPERSLQGERLEQSVIGEDRAKLATAFE